MLMAQITDTHIKPEGVLAYGRVDTAPYLARAVEHLVALKPRPDLVLATGDLVDSGRPDEYRRLHDLLAPLPMPVYLIPGNHDDRDALAAAFADHAYMPRGGGFIQYVVEGYPVRLIALDTLVAGEVGGLLCAERLGWLAARLAEAPDRPTVIFMHHPPFDTGIARMDAHGLANARKFADVVGRHRHAFRHCFVHFGLGFRLIHLGFEGDGSIDRGLADDFQQAKRKQGGDKADNHSSPQ